MPLMEAAWIGDLEGVKANLKEVGQKNEDGWTALMKAAEYGHANCIPLLEKEVGVQDNQGWTALMLAASNGQTDCTRLLLSEAGKQTTGKWNRLPPGMTALMMAARENHLEVVQLLLPYERGLKDSKGHTAKWYTKNSSKEGDFTRVRELLENEGIERIPPPPNPAEMIELRERVNELSAENDSLKKDLSSSKNAHEGTRKKLSQQNREVSSLKQQLEKYRKMYEISNSRAQEAEKSLAEMREENSFLKAQLTEMESSMFADNDMFAEDYMDIVFQTSTDDSSIFDQGDF
ncbi:Ankyrin repeat protein 3 [Giardia muris]|uniref:Ankyrin repeat protein 3 n=1 Tax=Giardia muris TaxID=5742 RepID=A0A4Z1SU19_GIAMU|nr:Ankyrin repeat protein 3 [Giardia muris]|eukprot:TNJ29412.1 Ankyrin repeat protein 3 [Giardia muris]